GAELRSLGLARRAPFASLPPPAPAMPAPTPGPPPRPPIIGPPIRIVGVARHPRVEAITRPPEMPPHPPVPPYMNAVAVPVAMDRAELRLHRRTGGERVGSPLGRAGRAGKREHAGQCESSRTCNDSGHGSFLCSAPRPQ